MHATLPADPLAIAAYLAERVADGAAAATVRTVAAPRSAPATSTPAPTIRPAMMASAAFCRASPAKRRAGAGARPIRSPLTTWQRSWQRPASPGAPGAAWNRKRMQPTGAPPIGRLSPCCSRVACAGRKRRRCAGRTCRTRGGRPRHRGLRPPVENRSGRHRGGRALPQERLRRRASPAPRPAHRAAVRVAPGRHRPGARRHQRPVHRTAPHRGGQRRRHRGANHRALRAGRPCRRIDQARRTGAGDGQGGRVEVVTDGRPLRGGRRSRAGRRR